MKKNNLKIIERERYNLQNSVIFSNEILKLVGSESVQLPIREPYLFYEQTIKEFVTKESKVLDICCGNGIYSFYPVFCGGRVTGIDISEKAIEVANLRSSLLGVKNSVSFLVNDAEALNLNEKYDLVQCIGSLSYIDLEIFISQVKKVLKPDGILIILDSYNHNIFFRLNRLFQVLLKKRNFATFLNIPDRKTVKKISQSFTILNLRYYNTIAWLLPILRLFFSIDNQKKIIDNFDKKCSLFSKYSFKIVVVAKNN